MKKSKAGGVDIELGPLGDENPADYRTIEDIPDDFSSPPLGSRTDLIESITKALPEVDFSDPSWGLIDGEECSIEVSLSRKELVNSIGLHVRGSGDEPINLISRLLNAVDARAIDIQAGDFFEQQQAKESWRKWQTYRDRVLSDNDEG